jgi:hypothetical protein
MDYPPCLLAFSIYVQLDMTRLFLLTSYESREEILLSKGGNDGYDAIISCKKNSNAGHEISTWR